MSLPSESPHPTLSEVTTVLITINADQFCLILKFTYTESCIYDLCLVPFLILRVACSGSLILFHCWVVFPYVVPHSLCTHSTHLRYTDMVEKELCLQLARLRKSQLLFLLSCDPEQSTVARESWFLHPQNGGHCTYLAA